MPEVHGTITKQDLVSLGNWFIIEFLFIFLIPFIFTDPNFFKAMYVRLKTLVLKISVKKNLLEYSDLNARMGTKILLSYKHLKWLWNDSTWCTLRNIAFGGSSWAFFLPRSPLGQQYLRWLPILIYFVMSGLFFFCGVKGRGWCQ